MSISRFEELIAILSEDYNKTEEYLERNSQFIEQLTLKLSDYIGCGLDNLFCYTPEADKNKASVQNNNIQSLIAEGFIKVVNEGSFEFPLLIQIKANPFNSQYCNSSFKEKQLAPSSKVVLVMTIKQHEENSFVVILPTVNVKEQVVEKRFTIEPTRDDSWFELLESSFKVIKKAIEGGLERRIKLSQIKTDNTPKKVILLP